MLKNKLKPINKNKLVLNRPKEETVESVSSTSGLPEAVEVAASKVIKYEITFANGDRLVSEGETADLMFKYLTECERIIAQYQHIIYQGPELTLVKAGK